MNEKTVEREALKDKLKILKRAGETIVFTNGCFDFLHIGHVRYLKAARALSNWPFFFSRRPKRR